MNARRALNEAQSVEQAQEIAAAARPGGAPLRRQGRADKGVLFGSVTQTNLADAIWDKLKVRVDRRKIGHRRAAEADRPLPGSDRALRRASRSRRACSSCPRAASCRPRRKLAGDRGGRRRPRPPQLRRPWRRSAPPPRAAIEEEIAEEEAVEEPEAEVAADAEPRPRPSRRLRSLRQASLRRRSHKRRTSSPQASAQPVDESTKNPLAARRFARRSRSASWGRHPTGWGESGERAFPDPASSGVSARAEPVRKAVVHPLKSALPATTNSDVAVLASTTQNAPVPPQNLDAEESVLGAMMLSPGAIGAVSEVLDAERLLPREPREDLPRGARALRARASRSTRSRSSTSSRSAASSRSVGGRERIHELAALVPATANAAHYARIVREMATLRGLDPRRAARSRGSAGSAPARRRSSSTGPSRSSSSSPRAASRPSSATSRRC